MDDSTSVAYASLLLIGGVQLMEQLGPGVKEVRTAERDAHTRAQLNVAELWAGTVVLGTGALLSMLADRWAPIAMASVVVVGSVVAYELAWRADPNTAVVPFAG